MKKSKLLYLLFLAGTLLHFTSCSEDDNKDISIDPPMKNFVLDFEEIQLPDTGFVNNMVYKSNILSFSNSYTPSSYGDYWEGFSFSRLTDITTPGLQNQYSVYGQSGADNSKKFAIAYASFEEPTHIQADSGIVIYPVSVAVNNSTYTALNIKNGDNYTEAFEAGDWFKVIFTGYNVKGEAGKTVEFYLADYRDKKTYICDEWIRVDLTPLQGVNKVTITFDSSDKGEFGVNQPQYVCLDNLKFNMD